MRNLVSVLRGVVDSAAQSPLPVQKIAVDGSLIVAVFGSEDEIVVQPWQSGEWLTEWEPFPSPGGRVCSVTADEDHAIMVFDNGDVVESRPDGAAVLGSLDTEVRAAEWSPDGEILCVVTSDQRVVWLSSSMSILGETKFQPEDLNLSKHVSVGWGKRETQFQGRGARAEAHRDPTMRIPVETGELAESDLAHNVGVSWRGDGEFVAVNTIEGSRRVVRVFARHGELSSVSEPVDHMSSIVAWQPAGAFITTVSGSRIIFFERNGLKRPGFDLPSADPVTSLAWSPDSDGLAVSYRDHVDLWASKNWHWYRKQTVRTGADSGPLQQVLWHPENPLTLLLQWESRLDTHSFAWHVCESQGTVAVIDTNEIKITPLARTAVPPPMALHSIKLASQPIHVAVSSTQLAIAFDDAVAVYSLSDQKLVDTLPVHVGMPQQVTWSDNGEKLIVVSTCDGRSYLDGVPTAESVILARPQGYLQANGTVLGYDHTMLAQLGPCIDMCIHSKWVFGLTRAGQLVAAVASTHPEPTHEGYDSNKNYVLGSGFSSIKLSGDILLATTPTVLKFVPVTSEPPQLASAEDPENREIDRGSVLVAVLEQRMGVVLQAPRGNIEIVFPRVLVVAAVRNLVSDSNYAAAFDACRRHRVDMNLLYDLEPAWVQAKPQSFVKQLGSSADVDLFLSGLANRDSANKNDPVPSKVNDVCELLFPVLSPQSKLTALALKQPPELGRALELALASPELGDTGISHLCYLTDPELLYRTALGMYDLQLALAVAQHAQMDPKEYLSFLRSREHESQERQHFAIDDHLRNYSKALLSLMRASDLSNDEVLEYITAHGLHATAVSALEPDPASTELGKLILRSQADLWLAQSRYGAAARNFEVLGEVPRAVQAYIQAFDWRAALSLDNSEQTASAIAETLVAHRQWADAAQVCDGWVHDHAASATYYCRAGRYSDAMLVSRAYNVPIGELLRDSFGSVQELLSDCASQIPSQVRRLRMVRAQRREDALNFAAGDGNDGGADDVSVAGTETTNAPSYVTRYTDKTGGTAQTGMTRRTQKNRRREERKKARGKRGTVYEEDYLIASVGRLVDRVTQTRLEAQDLVYALLRDHQRLYAVQIVKTYATVIDLLNENLMEVYSVAEEDLVRFDDEGIRFTVEKPVAPRIPELLSLE